MLASSLFIDLPGALSELTVNISGVCSLKKIEKEPELEVEPLPLEVPPPPEEDDDERA